MIELLLETRETLFDIAAVLYGDLWVANESFWGSPTERELTEIQNRLNNLGYEDDMSEEQLEAARKLAKQLGMERFDNI